MNYTAKRYLFEQSTVREFFSGAYYDLFLVILGSGVFRCSEVVLPAQQQNLLILKPGGDHPGAVVSPDAGAVVG